jgi:hypothetical protein
MSARKRPRIALLAAVAIGATATLTGCGIRATEGPINVGDAAKRPSPQGSTTTPDIGQHQIYLILDARPQPVLRGDSIEIQMPVPGSTRVPPAGDPLRMSQIDRLLRELAKGPSPEEAAKGWTSAVPPAGIRVADPQPGDPTDLVRLDVESLNALGPLALGQIVCTLQKAANVSALPLAGRSGPGRPQVCGAFQFPSTAPASKANPEPKS